MPERLIRFLDYIPFYSLVINHAQGPLVTRLIETGIMSLVAAAFATYVGVELLKKDVSELKDSVEKVDVKVEKLDGKVEKIRSDLYMPRTGR